MLQNWYYSAGVRFNTNYRLEICCYSSVKILQDDEFQTQNIIAI